METRGGLGCRVGGRQLTSVGVVAIILDRARLATLEVLIRNLGKLNHCVCFFFLSYKKT